MVVGKKGRQKLLRGWAMNDGKQRRQTNSNQTWVLSIAWGSQTD